MRLRLESSYNNRLRATPNYTVFLVSNMAQCEQFFVSGRVQGVFFRASTRDRAGELGLNGWVKNLADGRVQVLACGEPSALESLSQWLQQGPPRARVETVKREPATIETPASGFEIRH